MGISYIQGRVEFKPCWPEGHPLGGHCMYKFAGLCPFGIEIEYEFDIDVGVKN